MWYKLQAQVHITRLSLSSQIYVDELELRKVDAYIFKINKKNTGKLFREIANSKVFFMSFGKLF